MQIMMMQLQSTNLSIANQLKSLTNALTGRKPQQNPMNAFITEEQPKILPITILRLALPPPKAKKSTRRSPSRCPKVPEISTIANQINDAHQFVQPLPQFAQISNPNIEDTKSHETTRAYHEVAVRFKKKDSKYGGAEEETLHEFVDSYATLSTDYDLTATQKLQYLHNLFRGNALRFYNAQVKDKVCTYEEAVAKVTEHFNSLDVQQRIKTDLSTLQF